MSDAPDEPDGGPDEGLAVEDLDANVLNDTDAEAVDEIVEDEQPLELDDGVEEADSEDDRVEVGEDESLKLADDCVVSDVVALEAGDNDGDTEGLLEKEDDAVEDTDKLEVRVPDSVN